MNVEGTRRGPSRGVRVAAGAILVVAAGAAAAGAAISQRPPTALGPPRFVDETGSSGVAHTYDGGFAYAAGGGVAVFDCNGDGAPDVYLAGGVGGAELYRNDSAVGGPLHFTRVASAITDLPGVTGAYPLDVDGDGVVDLAVLRVGTNVLLRGLGGCRFERANETWGVDGGNAPTMAFSAAWETGQVRPTLAFGNYVDPASDDPHHLCAENTLLRPSGTRYGAPIALRPSWCALSMLFSDWSRSGRMDLRVSNDAHYYLPTEGEEQLWRIPAGAAPSLYTADDGWVRVQVEGMGIASYDLTGDGYPDVYLTSQGDNRLQTLVADASRPSYRDIGAKRGVNVAQPFTGGDARPSTSWHAEFADVNNDGFVDLLVTKGNVTTQADYATKDPSDLLLGQPDGTFVEAADRAGIVTFDRGRGAALADFNMDGMLDLIEVSYGAPVRVWRNVGAGDGAHPAAMGNWLALQVAQDGPNANAIGAWIDVRFGDRVVHRELTVGGGHAGGQLGWVHVGIGDARDADVRVAWPGGEVGPWQRVSADAFTIVRRGAATETWAPSRG